jgi:uncharacterized protein (DUF433 family)
MKGTQAVFPFPPSAFCLPPYLLAHGLQAHIAAPTKEDYIMATLINLDALRNMSWDDLLRRVHQGHEEIVIEDLTMPVAVLVDVNMYEQLSSAQQQAAGPVIGSSAEPIIRGSNVSVRELAQWHVKGDTAEALQRRFPMLSPAQIYGALAFYYDHTAEIDRLITQHNQG